MYWLSGLGTGGCCPLPPPEHKPRPVEFAGGIFRGMNRIMDGDGRDLEDDLVPPLPTEVAPNPIQPGLGRVESAPGEV